jgi:hypothetical protein
LPHDTRSNSAFHIEPFSKTAACLMGFLAKAQRRILLKLLLGFVARAFEFFQIDRVLPSHIVIPPINVVVVAMKAQLLRDLFQCKAISCKAFRHETVTLPVEALWSSG